MARWCLPREFCLTIAPPFVGHRVQCVQLPASMLCEGLDEVVLATTTWCEFNGGPALTESSGHYTRRLSVQKKDKGHD